MFISFSSMDSRVYEYVLSGNPSALSSTSKLLTCSSLSLSKTPLLLVRLGMIVFFWELPAICAGRYGRSVISIRRASAKLDPLSWRRTISSSLLNPFV